MTKLERFIKSVRELKAKSPSSIIILPPCTKGLPLGSYNLELLLECIALNLEGKKPLCRQRARKELENGQEK